MKQGAGFYEAAILEARREQLTTAAKRAEADKALFPSIAELLASRQEKEEKDDNEEKTPEAEWQLQPGDPAARCCQRRCAREDGPAPSDADERADQNSEATGFRGRQAASRPGEATHDRGTRQQRVTGAIIARNSLAGIILSAD